MLSLNNVCTKIGREKDPFVERVIVFEGPLIYTLSRLVSRSWCHKIYS